MFGMREAFTVGVVLAARDMYSNVLAKAQTDIKALSKTSQAEADKFTKSLATYQKIAGIGVAMTLAGARVAAFWEDAVATAGRNQAAMDRVMIAMGDSSVIMRNRIAGVFHDIKITWGMTDEALSEALRDLSGRLGDNQAALSSIGVVSAFARARNIDLAGSARMLTTIYNQYGSQMGDNLSVEEKYGVAANKLHFVLKGLGGDWETLNMFLGGAGLKAKAAGQSFDTLMAAVKVIGMEGGRLRTAGASMETMLEDMLKLRKQPGWEKFFPTYRETGNLLDLIGDIRKVFEGRGLMAPGFENQQKRLEALAKIFGTNADMVDLFIQRFDEMKKAEARLKDLGRETGKSSTLMRAADAQMETWEGTTAKFNARMEEFKEMLGEGGIPLIKSFHKTLGGLTEFFGKDPVAKYVLGTTATVIGLTSEVAKFAGPAMTMIMAIKIWRLNTTLASLAQATLAAKTAATTGAINVQALSVGNLSMKNWGLVGALSKIGLIGAAAFAGWEIGTLIRQFTDVDERLQHLFAHLKGGFRETEDETSYRIENLSMLMNKLRKGMTLTEPEKKYFLTKEWQIQKAGGATIPSFTRTMGKLGIAPGEARKYLGKEFKTTEEKPLTVIAPEYQAGGFVPKNMLAYLHAGEYVVPRSSNNQKPTTNNFYMTFNLNSSGSTALDAKNLARQVMREMTKALKFEARRYA